MSVPFDDRDIEIEALGESAVLIRFGDRVDAELNERAQSFARAIADMRLAGLIDAVPAYASVALYFDLELLPEAGEPVEIAEDALARWLAGARVADAPRARRVVLPASYGGDDGPDLRELAAHAQLTPEEVVARHTAVEYRVGMIGFLPGFPYLIGLDPGLHMPRHAQPRARVPSGSVGIGGAQTGVYPCRSPGGWRLIGRCAARMFDPARAEPSLLRPGDRVRFRAVAAERLAGTKVEIEDA